jgi:hypothetical protein
MLPSTLRGDQRISCSERPISVSQVVRQAKFGGRGQGNNGGYTYGEGKPFERKRRPRLHEYKINFGPGYRVYFGKDGEELIILLAGGTKKKQSEDITEAQALWADYKKRK